MSTFRKAERSQSYMKIAIEGVSGAGKTYSSILLASGLCNRFVFIDTENGSGELYSHLTDYDYFRMEPPFKPSDAIKLIRAAVEEGYDGLIIDSFSHFWKYILQYKETLDQQPRSNSFANWGKVKPMYEELKGTILHSPLHIVCCLRSKADYIQNTGSDGKTRIEKVGINPITEPENEYEFTTVLTIDRTHQAVASKDRTSLFDAQMPFTVSKETGTKVLNWLYSATGGTQTVDAEWVRVASGSVEAEAAHKEAEALGVGTEDQGRLLARVGPDPHLKEAGDFLTKTLKMDAPAFSDFKAAYPDGKWVGSALAGKAGKVTTIDGLYQFLAQAPAEVA